MLRGGDPGSWNSGILDGGTAEPMLASLNSEKGFCGARSVTSKEVTEASCCWCLWGDVIKLAAGHTRAIWNDMLPG